MRKVIVPVLLLLVSCGPKSVTPEIFLIPEGYTGMIRVVHNESCGQPEKFEGKKRVYEFDTTGILISQFKQELGIIHQEYYHVDKEGNRTIIPQVNRTEFDWDATDLDTSEVKYKEIGMFGMSTGNGSTESLGEYIVQNATIWNYNDDRYGRGNSSEYQSYFEELTRTKLAQCRNIPSE